MSAQRSAIKPLLPHVRPLIASHDRKVVRSFFPFPLFVYPSRLCNLACSYCFSSSGPQWQAETFLTSQWLRLLREAQGLGIPELRLSGGEPLSLPQIEWMWRQIVDHGMTWTLTTNGTLLARHLGQLSCYPPLTTWLSFHREFLSREAYLHTVRKATCVLPCVGVNLFVQDVCQDPSLLSGVLDAGVKRVKILRLTPAGRCRCPQEPNAQEAAAIAATALSQQRSGSSPPELRIEGLNQPGVALGPASCVLAEKPLLTLDQDGRAYACCITLGHAPGQLGDLTKEPLSAIVARTVVRSTDLPCRDILHEIPKGNENCPLQLSDVSS